MAKQKTNKLEPVFGLKLTKEDKEIIRAEAKKSRLTMSAYVRYIVFKEINKSKDEGE